MKNPEQRSVRAWMWYDWANSAFATTILAAVFPVYFASVLANNLSSAARATQMYTITLSISGLVVAVASPILGAWADAKGRRKRLLIMFALGGSLLTSSLFALRPGDWALALILFGMARVGFSGSIVFYDALLPHVAKPDEVDSVSAKGYALGYLGGGLLLVANIVMIFALPDNDLGVRISLASVGIWWLVFTIPLIRQVPEPPADDNLAHSGTNAASTVISGIKSTLGEIRQMPDLARFLIAFVIYNDAIGAIIAVATIYGAELRFGSMELILAVLLVQFVGIPYSLIFGSLPGSTGRKQRFLLTFVIANIILLPLAGIATRVAGPADVSGVAGAPYPGEAVTEIAPSPGPVEFEWTGASLEVTHNAGPDIADLSVVVDGTTLVDSDGKAVIIETDAPVDRVGEVTEIEIETAGDHRLVLDAVAGTGQMATIDEIKVLPPERHSNLGLILVLILAVQAVAAALAASPVSRLVKPIADRLDTKRSIMLALTAYIIIALWGLTLDSVVEFWGLAWLVAICQGGSQALSRSLFSGLIPASRSGEYFGFFSILSKFASIISPLLFTISVALFNNSRPAVGGLAIFFIVGMALLRRVNVERGQQRALSYNAPASR